MAVCPVSAIASMAVWIVIMNYIIATEVQYLVYSAVKLSAADSQFTPFLERINSFASCKLVYIKMLKIPG